MRKWMVKARVALLIMGAAVCVGMPIAKATISGSGMCWVPDWEFPIPCADVDDD